jgi:hypothetical protein
MSSKLREFFRPGKGGHLEPKPIDENLIERKEAFEADLERRVRDKAEKPVKNMLFGMMCMRLTRMAIGRPPRITMDQAVEIRERRKGKYGVK